MLYRFRVGFRRREHVEHAGERGHRASGYTERSVSRQTLSTVLLIVAIALFVLAAATLMPSSAPKVSDLGYSTLCPFAPYSTLALLFFGWLSWVVRGHVQRQPAENTK